MRKAWLLLFLFVAPVGAYEMPGNPDRYPSLGFNLSNTTLDGSRTYINHPGSGATVHNDDGGADIFTYGLDVRLPVTRALTVNMSLDQVEYDLRMKRDGNLLDLVERLNGHRWGVGVRFYLP